MKLAFFVEFPFDFSRHGLLSLNALKFNFFSYLFNDVFKRYMNTESTQDIVYIARWCNNSISLITESTRSEF